MGNPLQQQAQQYMNPYKFDGEAQNWHRFWKSWVAYLKNSDLGEVATDEQKAKMFAVSIPPCLADEMYNWMEWGGEVLMNGSGGCESGMALRKNNGEKSGILLSWKPRGKCLPRIGIGIGPGGIF
jgi:hypothetical protein